MGDKQKSKGFQWMDKDLHLEVSRKGGVNSSGKRHKWNSETARLAGIKGARIRWKARKQDSGKTEESID